MSPDVRMFSDTTSLTESVARCVSDSINQATKSGGQYFLALAGGNTPQALYRLLAEDYVDKITWTNVRVFWGDERYVPIDDPRSNFRMVRETLLDHVPIPSDHIHPMPTNYQEPDDAAEAYEITLRKFFSSEWPRFNLIILGMGTDGHTASLFPGSVSIGERRWVIASQAPSEPKQRITLTLPVLSNAELVFFIVIGADKAQVLEQTMKKNVDIRSSPAAGVLRTNARVIFWTDEEAAKLIKRT